MEKEYNKDFDECNKVKKKLDAKSKMILFKEGEIWWLSIGLNVGEEIYGKGKIYSRPVLVLKKISHQSCVVIPLSTQSKEGNRYFEFDIHNKRQIALIHQIKLVSTQRFIKRLATVPKKDFVEIRKAVVNFYSFS